MYEGAKEKMNREYLADRSVALGNSLKKFGFDVVGDFKVAGKGIAHAVAHPMETLHSARSGAERAAAYGKYFADRNVSLDERKEKLKGDVKKVIEGYNKLPFRQMYITAGLIAGGAAASFAGLPALHATLAGLMYGQRALGGAGFALNRRKGMEKRIAENPEHWLRINPMRLKIPMPVCLVSRIPVARQLPGITRWKASLAGSGTCSDITQQLLCQQIMRLQFTLVIPTYNRKILAFPRCQKLLPCPKFLSRPRCRHISVDAQAGHGYEFMTKRIWEQLHAQHLDPNKFAVDSDIHKLITADAKTINGVVHKLAEQHGFLYRPWHERSNKST